MWIGERDRSHGMGCLMWITGQVLDDRGRALPDVTIEVSGQHATPRRGGVTNAHGHYVLQDLRPGVYTITFTCSGFSTVQRKTDALTTYVATINARLQEQRPG
jgi:protocatechuate 3,4-dioxygenase beta subunit